MRLSSSMREAYLPVVFVFLFSVSSVPSVVNQSPERMQSRRAWTVDATVRIEDLAAEVADDFVIDRFSRLHERVRDSVRLHQARAQRDEHVSDHRFPAAMPPVRPTFSMSLLKKHFHHGDTEARRKPTINKKGFSVTR